MATTEPVQISEITITDPGSETDDDDTPTDFLQEYQREAAIEDFAMRLVERGRQIGLLDRNIAYPAVVNWLLTTLQWIRLKL